MLTLETILRVTKQQSAFGEGRHRFGHGTERIIPVPRDEAAAAKTGRNRNNYRVAMATLI